MLVMMSISSFLAAQVPGFEWAGQMGGDSAIQANSVTTDYLGNIIITGTFKGQADFDPSPDNTYLITSNGNADIFILKLDPNNNFLWAAGMGDYNYDRGSKVITDALGNIYLTGYFIGTIDADPGPGVFLMSQQRVTTIVLKIAPDGNLSWGKYFGQDNVGHAYGWSITLDNSGNVITAGTFYGRVDFDPGSGTFPMTSTGIYDGFIQKLNPNGNLL